MTPADEGKPPSLWPERAVVLLGSPGHGKTTLRRALARCFRAHDPTHGLPPHPEPRVGLTPPAYHETSETRLGGRLYSLADCPSPGDWWLLTTADDPDFDGAILVVSAAAGPDAETEEQLRWLPCFGPLPVVVFLAQCDRVADPGALAVAEELVRACLAASGQPADIPIVRGAAGPALSGDPAWRAALAELGAEMVRRFPRRPFRRELPLLFRIDGRSRVPPGRACVEGTVLRGRVRPGQEVAWVGAGAEQLTRVVRLVTGGGAAEEGAPGDTLRLTLDAQPEDAPGAQCLAAPGSIGAHRSLRGHIVAVVRDRFLSLYPGMALRCRANGHEVPARPVEVERGLGLGYGEHVTVALALSEALVLEPRTRFALSEAGQVVAAGVVVAVGPG